MRTLTLLLALLVLPGCMAAAIPVGLATLCCVTVTQKPPETHGKARSWIPFTVDVHAPRFPTFDELSGRGKRPQAEQQQPYPSRGEAVPLPTRGDDGMKTQTQCSWRHAMNPRSEKTCSTCGHNAQTPRFACRTNRREAAARPNKNS